MTPNRCPTCHHLDGHDQDCPERVYERGPLASGQSEVHLATLEVHLTVVDEGKQRQRWNGDPMASREANAALLSLVESLRSVAKAKGLTIFHTSYGVLGERA